MANIIVKSDERKEHEKYVMRSFAVNSHDKEAREKAETVAARSREAYCELKRLEERYR